MNPFNFFKTYATAKGLEQFEKQLTEFLIHNRLFQYFAHRSESALKETGDRIIKEAVKAAKTAEEKILKEMPRGENRKLKP